MKKVNIIIASLFVLAMVLGLAAMLPTWMTPPNAGQVSTWPTVALETFTPEETTQPSEPVTAPTTEPTTEPTEPITEPTVAPTTEPTAEPERFLISFAGDCTFADNAGIVPEWNHFTQVVGDRYDYPFAAVKQIFGSDDLTIVNLECALTTYVPTPEEMEQYGLDKTYRFAGDPGYVNILSGSSVEAVSLANNHAMDFAPPGLKETTEVLKNAGIRYASWSSNCLMTTSSGLVVGIYASNDWGTNEGMVESIQKLREQGAQVVIVSLHWGEERHYASNENQQTRGHMAIDAGADIVFGHHPHVLQPIEYYNGGLIMYSLGNFSFGGNRNPVDKDTAIIQQEILRYEDGTVALGETIIIPCRISSVANRNDYQPTPYEEGSADYLRVISKLDGTYAQQWLEEQAAKNPTT